MVTIQQSNIKACSKNVLNLRKTSALLSHMWVKECMVMVYTTYSTLIVKFMAHGWGIKGQYGIWLYGVNEYYVKNILLYSHTSLIKADFIIMLTKKSFTKIFNSMSPEIWICSLKWLKLCCVWSIIKRQERETRFKINKILKVNRVINECFQRNFERKEWED